MAGVPPREEEARAADVAFQAALVAIGVDTVADSLALWEDVPVGAAASTAASWLGRALALIFSHRAQSRDVAIAYYRLVRALRTGTTIPLPGESKAQTITLSKLRSEFRQLVDEATGGAQRPAADSAPSTPTPSTPETSQEDSAGGDEEIRVEDIGVDIDALDKDLADTAEVQAKDLLINLGPVAQHKYTQQIDMNRPAKDVLAEHKTAHDKAGARQASAAEHTALNGGRGVVFALAERDPRVIGWVRYSKTGTPCGFCAMLISRGAILKDARGKEVRQAQLYSGSNVRKDEDGTLFLATEDGDKYHINCHCAALPIYSMAQWETDPKYAINREYARLWPQVTKGLSGKDALNAWRTFIERQNSDEQQVQAA